MLFALGPAYVIQVLVCAYVAFTSIAFILKILYCIKIFGWPKLWKANLKQRFGPWAVITGSTDGIGKAYARELAKRGIHVVLLSRSLHKLQDVSSDIRSEYGVEVDVIQVDFSAKNVDYEEIRGILRNKDIGFLVNNVGIAMGTVRPFYDLSEDEIWHHISINMMAPTYLTKIILPQMIKRGRGAIINIASTCSKHPHPFVGIYSATKAYNRFFSTCLRHEMKEKGVTVQTITPNFVSTAMVASSPALSRPSLLVPSAETFASSALDTLGYTDETCGYLYHELLDFLYLISPEWLRIRATAFICRRYIANKK